MRSGMFTRTYYNHMGIEKCKLKARACLFWPRMMNDIKNLVTKCETCVSESIAQRISDAIAGIKQKMRGTGR